MAAARPFSPVALAQVVRQRRARSVGATLPARLAITSCLRPVADLAGGLLSRPVRPARTVLQAGGHPFGGYLSVGKLYFRSDLGEQSCPASVIDSPKPPKAGRC